MFCDSRSVDLVDIYDRVPDSTLYKWNKCKEQADATNLASYVQETVPSFQRTRSNEETKRSSEASY
jgi:hypothetical protein